MKTQTRNTLCGLWLALALTLGACGSSGNACEFRGIGGDEWCENDWGEQCLDVGLAYNYDSDNSCEDLGYTRECARGALVRPGEPCP